MEEFRNIPIVALSASVNEDSISKCIEAGCTEHLGKPVQLSVLFACIDKNLGLSSQTNGSHSKTPAHARRDTEDRALRVLIAEDSPTSRDFMGEFFSRQHDEVTFATDGREAVEKALGGDFDVVLMDVSMPVMNGLDATREIRQVKDSQQLPIVGLSGAESGEGIQACLDAGMNDFLAKPVRFARVLQMLNAYRGREHRTSETPNNGK